MLEKEGGSIRPSSCWLFLRGSQSILLKRRSRDCSMFQLIPYRIGNKDDARHVELQKHFYLSRKTIPKYWGRSLRKKPTYCRLLAIVR